MKWEYTSAWCDQERDHIDFLNGYGKDGWKLVTIYTNHVDGIPGVEAIFARRAGWLFRILRAIL